MELNHEQAISTEVENIRRFYIMQSQFSRTFGKESCNGATALSCDGVLVQQCRGPMGHLGETLGPIFVNIMKDEGRKAKTGPQKWHVDVEWHT